MKTDLTEILEESERLTRALVGKDDNFEGVDGAMFEGVDNTDAFEIGLELGVLFARSGKKNIFFGESEGGTSYFAADDEDEAVARAEALPAADDGE